MDRIDKNGTTIFFFIVVLIGIIVGGYYLINNKNNNSNNNKEYVNSKTRNLVTKLDNDKDYIYFDNEVVESEEEELSFKDIKFNFESNDAKKVEDKFNGIMKNNRNSIEKDADVVKKMESIDYDVIVSSKYLSLIVNEYSYNLDEGKNIDNFSYYVFDLYSGKILDNKDIMKNENIKEDDIIKKIKEYIADDDTVNKDKTLKNDYYLTINKNGKVILNFIVNSDNINYNVSIGMD